MSLPSAIRPISSSYAFLWIWTISFRIFGFFANLFKENQNYKITIFEKKKSIELGEGYGIQLSTNSIKLLNEIGFNEVSENDKFNPEKIDFRYLTSQAQKFKKEFEQKYKINLDSKK